MHCDWNYRCCHGQVIGSGMFDDDGRVLALNHSRPEVRPDTHENHYQVEVPQLSNDRMSGAVIESTGSVILPFHSSNDCVSEAPTYIMESLNNLPFHDNDDDVEMPCLTSSSTKSSVTSTDSSPVSSVCSSNPSGSSDGDGLCRTRSQDDELSSTNSCYSSDDGPITHDSSTTSSDPSPNTPCPRSAPDLYSQTHPIESTALMTSKLREFDHEILHAAASKKCGIPEPKFLIAERTCPNITTPSFKLIFLRCECYDVPNALKRYTRYWEKRVELFGPLRAYQPITIQSLYVHNDHRSLELGALQIIQRVKSYDTTLPIDTNTPDERDMLWFDPSKLDPAQYSRESGCRALWYLFHALLEDVQVQQRGLICINYSAHFSLKNRDPLFTRMCISSLQGCLPIRISVFHGCHPPPIYRIVARFLLFMLGERLRKRVIPHSGTNEHVNSILRNKYNISENYIPTDMDGNFTLNTMEWIRQRKDAGL